MGCEDQPEDPELQRLVERHSEVPQTNGGGDRRISPGPSTHEIPQTNSGGHRQSSPVPGAQEAPRTDGGEDQRNSPVPSTHDCAKTQKTRATTEESKMSAGKNSLAKNKASFVKSLTGYVWLSETLCCIIAMAALAAIIITLAIHQGKALPKWPSMISINTLIAIFTSILKAAMLLPIAEGLSELKWIWFATSRPLTDMERFDLASRGPWGSLLLFFKRSSVLAYLGAFITIVALAVDPFTQQILQYHECLTPVPDGSGTISRTNNYTAAGLHLGAGETSLDGSMAAAMYQGVLSPPANATASIAFDCASGNCTFPAVNSISYTSLAMCASVEDISHSITGNGSLYYYTLPSGLSTYLPVLFSCGKVALATANEVPLFTFEAIMINCKGAVNETTLMCPQTEPWAFRATLYPCVHEYGNVKISKFILQEQELSTSRVPFMNINGGDYFSLAGDHPSLAGLDCTPSVTRDRNNTFPTSPLQDGVRYVNRSSSAIGAPDTLWFNPACTYEIGPQAVEALTGYLPTAFFGLASEPNKLSSPYGSPTNTFGDAWLERLYASGTANLSSVTGFMEGLANSMTATIRQRGDASNSVPATGTLLGNPTCIRVQWQWLSLPAALLALTLAFFAAVVLQSQQSTQKGRIQGGRKAWKSSSLPLLWCGLDDEVKQRYGTLNDLLAMKDRGDELKVSLGKNHDVQDVDKDEDEGRWFLREAGEEQ